jgi:hypothetical protein
MSVQTITRKLFLGLGLTILLALPFLSVPVNAAEFYVPEDGNETVTISEPAENAYVAGTTINVDAPIRKDLIVAGQDININESVFRSVFAAGQTINFNLSENGVVQGSVRAAGNEIVISGNYIEDVIVAGQNVRFENARIRGEVYVSAQSVEVVDSQILGNFTMSAGEFDEGAIDEQVQGDLTINDPQTNVDAEAGVAIGAVGAGLAAVAAFVSLMILIANTVSFIVGLLIIYFVLKKYNKTELKGIKFDGKFGQDFAIGFVLTVVVPIVTILLMFLVVPLFLLPLILTITALLGSILALAQPFLPIYLANFARNVFGWNLGVGALTAIAYLLVLTLNILTFFFWFPGIILFIISLSSFGYVLRHVTRSLKNSLKSEQTAEVEEK